MTLSRDELHAARAQAQYRIRKCREVMDTEASKLSAIERQLAAMRERDICILDARAAQKVYDALLLTEFAANPHRLHIVDAAGGMRRVYESYEVADDTPQAELPQACPACTDKDVIIRRLRLEIDELRQQSSASRSAAYQITEAIAASGRENVGKAIPLRPRCNECGALAFPESGKCIIHQPLPQTKCTK